MPPRVTVLTPTWNRARTFLPETIRSVLAQTFTDFEYIIASDGSEDDTVQVVREFMEKDDRIRLIELPRIGSIGTWTALLSAAKGKYVAWLSDDDLWNPDYLARMLTVFEHNDDAIVVYSDYSNLRNGQLVPSREARRCGLHREHLQYGCYISLCFAVIDRRALDSMRHVLGYYFDPIGGSVCNDWVLFLNLFQAGKLKHLCDELGMIRMHDEQESVRSNVIELARRRFAVRRKYAGLSFARALREAFTLVAWGTWNRTKKRVKTWLS